MGTASLGTHGHGTSGLGTLGLGPCGLGTLGTPFWIPLSGYPSLDTLDLVPLVRVPPVWVPDEQG